MTSLDLGNIILATTILVAIAAAGSAIVGAANGVPVFMRAARWMIGALAGLLTLASLLLLLAMLGSDFRYEYVVYYSEQALPDGYKAAAFWAGQAGSLLLWAWLLGVMGVLVVISIRFWDGWQAAGVIVTLALSIAAFSVLMLGADRLSGAEGMASPNPFKPIAVVPADGMGLNPMLQNPGMLAHPPLLFIGYAAYTIPFAFMVGALVARRRDNQWLDDVRRWSLFAWLFLTAGIIWGGEWAYTELGWGGYWAWDPVENASLLPWLTGTALVHSLMVQRSRGIFKRWNVLLISASFFLCIFGTYLTRSGVVQSVHSFGKHPIGNLLIMFMALIVLATLVLMVVRWRDLQPERSLENLFSREGAFLGVNVLLSLITLVVTVGTIMPVLSAWAAELIGMLNRLPLVNIPMLGQEISVGEPFYNTIAVPMLLALVALMAMGPMLRGQLGFRQFARELAIPVSLGVAVVAVMGWYAWGGVAEAAANPGRGLTAFGALWAELVPWLWAMLAVFLVTVTVAGVGTDLVRSAAVRSRATGEAWLAAIVRMIDANHRRYGGQIAHLGVALMVLGVAGSSLFDMQETFRLRPGETARIGGYTLTYNRLDEVRMANYTAVQADVTVTAPDGGIFTRWGWIRSARPQNPRPATDQNTFTLLPERRFFDKAKARVQMVEQPDGTMREESVPSTYSQVAMRSNLREDLYLVLAGWEPRGSVTAIQAMVNPLVLWIWIGAVVACLGGIFAMLPRMLGRRETVETLQAPQAQPVAHTPPAQGERQPRRKRRQRRKHEHAVA